MGKCKNIECGNETEGKRVYCSLKCRNVYVNKYLRDYSKTSEGFEKKRKEKESEYLKSPKQCKECEEIIPYDKKENDFCDKSCSNSYSNKNRILSYETKEKISISISNYIQENGNFGCLTEESRKNRTRPKILNKKCKGCGKKYSNKNQYFCNQKCQREYNRKHMDEYEKYKADCKFKFSLNDYPDKFDFDLIREHGWYKPTNRGNNLNGVSRDHIYSVREGFENRIDPEIISHPANCQLLVHGQNISKNKRSDITIDELLEKIEKW